MEKEKIQIILKRGDGTVLITNHNGEFTKEGWDKLLEIVNYYINHEDEKE